MASAVVEEEAAVLRRALPQASKPTRLALEIEAAAPGQRREVAVVFAFAARSGSTGRGRVLRPVTLARDAAEHAAVRARARANELPSRTFHVVPALGALVRVGTGLPALAGVG
jgi:hypothetical protein